MIIGICGLIGSGKGTVADMLVDDFGFEKISFADKLKDGVATIFGWDRAMLEGDTKESRAWREQPDAFWSNELGKEITPRLVLQLFGTDCMRVGFDNNIWVSLVKQELVRNPNTNYVIPDTRFPNEMEMIRQLNGEVWQVRRGDLPEWFDKAILDNNTGSNLMDAYDIHQSEWKWIDTNNKFENIVYNDSTLKDLSAQVSSKINQ